MNRHKKPDGAEAAPAVTPRRAAALARETLATYYHAWFRFHPEAAVDAGVRGFEAGLAPYDDDDMGALITLNEELLGGIDELPVEMLDADTQLDCWLAYGAAFLEMEKLVEADWRGRDPERFLPVNAIYQLTVCPVADFAGALSARLAAIPEYLRGARPHLADQAERIPPLWLDSAVTAARRGAEYLRGLTRHPKVLAHEKRLRGMDGSLATAAGALLAYADFLERELKPRAHGDFACGTRYFQHLLQRRHFLDLDADEMHRFGTALVAQTERELRDACRALAGNDDVAALSRRIRAAHPPAARLLDVYREQMAAAREFVRDRALVGLPAGEQLAVVETPVFLRHLIPFAAYREPAPNDREQRGYYYVTPALTEETLAEHSEIGIMHTCVHEAWPGHHLQFVTANLSPTAHSLPRLLNASATLYEGWALYCEQLMQEQGFLHRPESRFVLLQDRLWRALRIVLDVELHTRGLDFETAAERLTRHLGFPKPQAVAEIAWYSHAPTVPLGYATGWALINATRDQLRLTEPQVVLQSFHDRLLASGSVALPLAIRRAFGETTWERARGMVFGAHVTTEAP